MFDATSPLWNYVLILLALPVCWVIGRGVKEEERSDVVFDHHGREWRGNHSTAQPYGEDGANCPAGNARHASQVGI